MGEQFSIGVHVSRSPESMKRPSHLLHLMMQVIRLIARQNLGPSMRHADFVIAPDVGAFKAFNFGNAEQLVDIGYATAMHCMPELRAKIQTRNRWWRRAVKRFGRRVATTRSTTQ
jgi:predicted acylesterase/phospholipase RssA